MGLNRPKENPLQEEPKENPLQIRMAMIYSLVETEVSEGKDKAIVDTKKSFFFSTNFIA